MQPNYDPMSPPSQSLVRIIRLLNQQHLSSDGSVPGMVPSAKDENLSHVSLHSRIFVLSILLF